MNRFEPSKTMLRGAPLAWLTCSINSLHDFVSKWRRNCRGDGVPAACQSMVPVSDSESCLLRLPSSRFMEWQQGPFKPDLGPLLHSSSVAYGAGAA